MSETPEEFRERLYKDAAERTNEELRETTTELLTILNSMKPGHQQEAITVLTDDNLRWMLKTGQRGEFYEICQLVVNEYKRRGIS